MNRLPLFVSAGLLLGTLCLLSCIDLSHEHKPRHIPGGGAGQAIYVGSELYSTAGVSPQIAAYSLQTFTGTLSPLAPPLTPTNSSLQLGSGLAVDGAGNVYASSTACPATNPSCGNTAWSIAEFPASASGASSSTIVPTAASSGVRFTALAVDGCANVLAGTQSGAAAGGGVVVSVPNSSTGAYTKIGPFPVGSPGETTVSAITTDSLGDVYVLLVDRTDANNPSVIANPRVEEFPAGASFGQFAGPWQLPATVVNPIAIAVDSNGRIYVLDTGPASAPAPVVLAYTPAANAAPWAPVQNPNGLLSSPVGLAVDATNNLYVLNGTAGANGTNGTIGSIVSASYSASVGSMTLGPTAQLSYSAGVTQQVSLAISPSNPVCAVVYGINPTTVTLAPQQSATMSISRSAGNYLGEVTFSTTYPGLSATGAIQAGVKTGTVTLSAGAGIATGTAQIVGTGVGPNGPITSFRPVGVVAAGNGGSPGRTPGSFGACAVSTQLTAPGSLTSADGKYTVNVSSGGPDGTLIAQPTPAGASFDFSPGSAQFLNSFDTLLVVSTPWSGWGQPTTVAYTYTFSVLPVSLSQAHPTLAVWATSTVNPQLICSPDNSVAGVIGADAAGTAAEASQFVDLTTGKSLSCGSQQGNMLTASITANGQFQIFDGMQKLASCSP